MIVYGKKKHRFVLYLSVISAFFSAVVVSYENLPEALRDNLPISFKTILTTLTLFSSGLASIVHILNISPYLSSPQEKDVDDGSSLN